MKIPEAMKWNDVLLPAPSFTNYPMPNFTQILEYLNQPKKNHENAIETIAA